MKWDFLSRKSGTTLSWEETLVIKTYHYQVHHELKLFHFVCPNRSSSMKERQSK